MSTDLKSVIGLEVHVQLKTKSKMFCRCLNDSSEHVPNVNICPVCLGHPGTLPIINQEALEKIIKIGLALNCKILPLTKFDRKNYFYPDLPKGYQISQYDLPLCENGYLDLKNGRRINIQRIHLEEDAGKLIHGQQNNSLVDFNRAGVPLMELVTNPDFQDGEEAREFARELQLILRYLGISNADMEMGEMRVEANISVQSIEAEFASGTKVEIKNLNSFKAAKEAIEYEIVRQTREIKNGEQIIQETRGWDGKKTVLHRIKEGSADYRYLPEPDLPYIKWDKSHISQVKNQLEELPSQKRKRFMAQYDLLAKQSEILVREITLGNYFEKVSSELENWLKIKKINKLQDVSPNKLLANYLISNLLGLLNGSSIKDKNFLITPENFGEFIALIIEKEIGSMVAKSILKEMFETGKDPSSIIEEKGLLQDYKKKQIEEKIKEIIKENKQAVKDYQKGKESAIQFLLGQLMQRTQGGIDPKVGEKIIKELLKRNVALKTNRQK